MSDRKRGISIYLHSGASSPGTSTCGSGFFQYGILHVCKAVKSSVRSVDTVMARGRIPQPKAINDLKGDPHKRRRHKAEPTPPKTRPECPAHLDAVAKAEWESVTAQLDQMGLLSSADTRALEMYCAAYSRYRAAEDKVRQYGEVIVSPVTKYPMVSPYSTTLNKNLEICRKFQIEFGLTPAARSRLATTPQSSTPDKWNGLLGIVA